MPFVTIEWFEGRSGDQKREIAQQLTELLCEVAGTPRDQVWIRFVDSRRSDWAIGGAIQDDGADGARPPA